MKLCLFNVMKTKRECICIHIGQAGVQIGNSCWELFCLGEFKPENTDTIFNFNSIPVTQSMELNQTGQCQKNPIKTRLAHFSAR